MSTPGFSMPILAAGYAVSSSLITIVNKYAIGVFPFPAFLTMLQYFCSFLFVMGKGSAEGGAENVLGHKGWLDAGIFRRFFPAAVVYYLAIFTNTKILLYANVETFIVFRSSTPIFVAAMDSIFMGRPWPSFPTIGALLTIFGGALLYMITDSQFTVLAYSWAFAYLVVITFDMIFIKHVVTHIGLPTWGLVYYNNFTAFLLSPVALWVCGEFRAVTTPAGRDDLPTQLVPVLVSCLFGVSISYFGFACRQALSPTAFTVLGVMNKLLTILINVLIWDKHASPVGVVALLLCIAGGIAYERTAKKSRAAAAVGQGDKLTPLPQKRVTLPLLTLPGPEAGKAAVPDRSEPSKTGMVDRLLVLQSSIHLWPVKASESAENLHLVSGLSVA